MSGRRGAPGHHAQRHGGGRARGAVVQGGLRRRLLPRIAAASLGRPAEGCGRLREPVAGEQGAAGAGRQVRREVHLLQRRALHPRGGCRGARPPDMPQYGARPGRPEPYALHVPGVPQITRGDGRAVPRPPRGTGHDARDRCQMRGLQAHARPSDAELPAAGGFQDRPRGAPRILRQEDRGRGVAGQDRRLCVGRRAGAARRP